MKVELVGPELYVALGPLVVEGQLLGVVPVGKQFVIDFDLGLNGQFPFHEVAETREEDLAAGILRTAAAVRLVHPYFINHFKSTTSPLNKASFMIDSLGL